MDTIHLSSLQNKMFLRAIFDRVAQGEAVQINYRAPSGEAFDFVLRAQETQPLRASASSLGMNVDRLPLTAAAANALKAAGLYYLGDLARRDESQLAAVENLGRGGIKQVKDALESLGLSLGMETPDWPSESLEDSPFKYFINYSDISKTSTPPLLTRYGVVGVKRDQNTIAILALTPEPD